jgi:hypothetical protein
MIADLQKQSALEGSSQTYDELHRSKALSERFGGG